MYPLTVHQFLLSKQLHQLAVYAAGAGHGAGLGAGAGAGLGTGLGAGLGAGAGAGLGAGLAGVAGVPASSPQNLAVGSSYSLSSLLMIPETITFVLSHNAFAFP